MPPALDIFGWPGWSDALQHFIEIAPLLFLCPGTCPIRPTLVVTPLITSKHVLRNVHFCQGPPCCTSHFATEPSHSYRQISWWPELIWDLTSELSSFLRGMDLGGTSLTAAVMREGGPAEILSLYNYSKTKGL